MKSWFRNKWNKGKMLYGIKACFISVSDFLLYDFYLCSAGILH